MIIQIVNHRLLMLSESKDETNRLRGYGFLEKKGSNFSCEDSLINRLLVNYMPEELENPIVKGTSYASLNVDCPLRDYQKQDVRVMLEWGSLINANDMGLGKTLETITYCQWAGFHKILIICPKAVISHWVNQFEKWGQQFTVTTSISEMLIHPVNVLVTNYEQLYSKLEAFQGCMWDLIVCDEAHKIKNHRSQIGTIIHKLPSKNRLALTGTPITNLVDDMYNILYWVNPQSVGKGYWHFVDMFCYVPYNPFGQKIEGLTKNKDRIKLLQRIINNNVIRHTKIDVIKDLPSKGVYDIVLSFDKAQRELYDDVKKLIFEKLPPRCTIANAAIHLLRLIQVTSNPQLFKPECVNPKFEYIKKKLDENPDKQFVIFSQFVNTIKALAKFLNVAMVTVCGSDTIEERNKAVNSFSEGSVRVIGGSVGAMGQGIDGLQNNCSTAIFIDASWSPQINQQAEDRIYRIGQKLPVDIYYLQLEKSVDQLINARLDEKELDVRQLL